MTPLFLGGSLPSPAFLPRPQREGRFRTANHKRLRQIEESGFAALLDLPMPHPPSVRVASWYGLGGIKPASTRRIVAEVPVAQSL